MNPGSPTNGPDDEDVLMFISRATAGVRAREIALGLEWANQLDEACNRRLDRALQRLRRRGRIICDGGRWSTTTGGLL